MRIKTYFILRGIYIFIFTVISYFVVLKIAVTKFPNSTMIIQIILIPSYILAYVIGVLSSKKKYNEIVEKPIVEENKIINAIIVYDISISTIIIGLILFFISGIFLFKYMTISKFSHILLGVLSFLVAVMMEIYGIRMFIKTSESRSKLFPGNQ